jgi:hypothetical protein
MKLNISTTILIPLLITLAIALVPFSNVQAGNISDIVFENSPLFNEANIVPGDAVTRSVKVNNKTNNNIVVNTAAINMYDPDKLGDMLNITIKNGTNIVYQNTLSVFFNTPSVSLGFLSGNANAQYDYSVNFKTEAGNNYQEKTLTFDITVTTEDLEGSTIRVGGSSSFLSSSYGGGLIFPNNSNQQNSTGSAGNNNNLIVAGVEGTFNNPDDNSGGKPVVVLGIELPASGFNIQEFMILIIVLIILLTTAFFIKRKYLIKK